MIKAVIFDVDGTLVDTVDLHARAWTETFQHFGIDADFEQVRSQIGKGGDQLMPVFVDASVLQERGGEIEQFRSDLFRREYLNRSQPLPGVKALIERLKADGKRIALGSSGKAEEVEHHQRVLDISGMPDVVTTGDDAEHSKPFPDIFLAAFDKLQPVEREAVVVVGDSPFDAHAAISAGLTPVAVLTGGFPENELRAAGFVEVHAGPESLLASYEQSILGRKS